MKTKHRSFDDTKNSMRGKMSFVMQCQAYFPQKVLRRRKQGFSAPDESWYRGEALSYVREVPKNKRAAYRDFLNPGFVFKILEDHANGRKTIGSSIFNVS